MPLCQRSADLENILRACVFKTKNRHRPAGRFGLSGSPYLILWVACLIGATGCHTFRTKPIDFRASLARQLTCDGLDSLQSGRYDDAEKTFAQAVRAAPKDQRIRAEWSRALANQGHMDRAIEEMTKATELAPADAVYHVQLGDLYLQTARWQQAVDEADLALDHDRQSAAAWALKGRGLRGLQQLEQAKTHLHRAAALDPDAVAVRFELAQIHYELQDPQRALVVLEGLARSADPADLPVGFALLRGRALADAGQFELATETLVAAIEAGNVDPELMLQLSRVQVESGDEPNARLTLMRGRELFGDHPEFQTRLESLSAHTATQATSRF